MLGSSWNVMAHGDAREGKWRGNWRMEWVASTPHTILEYGVSNTTADVLTSAASSWLNWHRWWFKWTHPFRWKMKSGLCACAITFETQSTCQWMGSVRTVYAHSVLFNAMPYKNNGTDTIPALAYGWIIITIP